MEFGSMTLTKRKTGVIEGSFNGTTYRIEPTDPQYSLWDAIYKNVVLANDSVRPTIFQTFLDDLAKGASEGAVVEPPKELTPDERLTRGIKNLMEFFKEFSFEPSFRFVNTFVTKAVNKTSEAKAYLVNYFALMDNQYTGELKGKVRSKEFNGIIDDITACGVPSTTINKRLSIYFGSAGTGKTTLGMEEADNRCIVCNASMLPSDLMEDFVFSDGKPSFQKSSLWVSMEEGLPIVFDEINLLPYDSLRFLQGILDGKSEVNYKGNIIKIKDGFRIIGTMNLSLGGMVYGLPEPLVDRCSDIKEFKLTAEQLKKAVVGA